MTNGIDGLDHTLVGVRDLEAARAAWTRLGFTCTPRGSHIGWGTANYCIMFEADYIELLGIVDASKFCNRLDEFLARREGLMAVAFATRDAHAAHAELTAAGIAAEPPRALARNLELPEGTVQPRFELVHLPAQATPAMPAFLCRHLTPDMVRRPGWLDHANGARAISAVTVVVEDPPALADAYGRLFGPGALTPTDDVLSIRVGALTVVFARPADFGLFYPGVDFGSAPGPEPAPPFIAAMTIAVDDADETARVLDAGGVAYSRTTRDALVAPPSETCGVVLEFSRG